jgi:chromosome segregation ATPase
MKNVLRDWLGINEEKFALEVQLNTLQQKLDELDEKYSDVDDKVESLKYEVEDRVSEWDLDDRIREIAYYDIDDIKNDLDEDMDYSEITDNVFDLVMQEIENRDTLQELVEAKLEALTDEGRNNTGAYPDITEIVEDVVEELINKLRA